MNCNKNLLDGARYESPELTVVELHLEGAVLQASGGGGIGDLNDTGEEI